MGRVIATVMSLLMLALACMSMALLMLPILQKVKIEQLIRDVSYEANIANGFDFELKGLLAEELKRLGLQDVELNVPMRGDLERFESREFTVSGKLKVKRFGAWLYMYEETLPFYYKGKVFGKRILN